MITKPRSGVVALTALTVGLTTVVVAPAAVGAAPPPAMSSAPPQTREDSPARPCARDPFTRPEVRPCLTMRLPGRLQQATADRRVTVTGEAVRGTASVPRVVRLQRWSERGWRTVARTLLVAGAYRFRDVALTRGGVTLRAVLVPVDRSRAGSRSAPRVTAAPLTIGAWDVLRGLEKVAGLYRALRACSTPAGCFASRELQELYENQAVLGDLRRRIEALEGRIDALTQTVQEGFRQLQVDVKGSAYAAAVQELDWYTTRSREAYLTMLQVLDPKPLSPDVDRDRRIRDRAFVDFSTYAARLDGTTLGMLRAVGGDPTDPLSTAGVLPSAWDLLMAKQRQDQQLPTDREVPFLTKPVIDQMRDVGLRTQFQQAETAAVLSVYRTSLADDPADADEQAGAVVRRFDDGDRDHPGLVAQEAALPLPLPTLTGVFVAAEMGTVTGNFGLVKASGDGYSRLVSADRQEAVGRSVWSDKGGSGLALEGRTDAPAQVKLTSDSRQLRLRDGDRTRCFVPAQLPPVAGTRVTLAACDRAEPWQRFEVPGAGGVTDGTVRPVGNSDLCLTHDGQYAPTWSTMPGPNLLLRPCRPADPAMQWYADGIGPTGGFMPEDVRAAQSLGSPLGEDADGRPGRWAGDWQLPSGADTVRIADSVATRAGVPLARISDRYAGPAGDPMLRLLPSDPTQVDGKGRTGPLSWVQDDGCGPPVAAGYWQGGGQACATSRNRTQQVSAILIRHVDACEFRYVKTPRRNPADRIGGDC